MTKIAIYECPHCHKKFPYTGDANIIIHCAKHYPLKDLSKHLKHDACPFIGEVELPDAYIMRKWEKIGTKAGEDDE